MLQITLHAPAISCDHCIATIERTVSRTPGARFVSGTVEGRRFAIEITEGSVLDQVAAALAAEDYPLGPAIDFDSSLDAPRAAATSPVYRVSPTDAGAEINYDCPCGCVAGFAFNRATAIAEPEWCCCGRAMLVGRAAEERLRAALAGAESYWIDVQHVTMPWGQPMEVSLAVPAPSTGEVE
ncbi:MAG: heavy-metal-associated domain-containing protein [Dehalococcoidia bacterium]|nr:heavy-metal-associated domain-containing protein [Dehalococcoidia bacterium]